MSVRPYLQREKEACAVNLKDCCEPYRFCAASVRALAAVVSARMRATVLAAISAGPVECIRVRKSGVCLADLCAPLLYCSHEGGRPAGGSANAESLISLCARSLRSRESL